MFKYSMIYTIKNVQKKYYILLNLVEFYLNDPLDLIPTPNEFHLVMC